MRCSIELKWRICNNTNYRYSDFIQKLSHFFAFKNLAVVEHKKDLAFLNVFLITRSTEQSLIIPNKFITANRGIESNQTFDLVSTEADHEAIIEWLWRKNLPPIKFFICPPIQIDCHLVDDEFIQIHNLVSFICEPFSKLHSISNSLVDLCIYSFRFSFAKFLMAKIELICSYSVHRTCWLSLEFWKILLERISNLLNCKMMTNLLINIFLHQFNIRAFIFLPSEHQWFNSFTLLLRVNLIFYLKNLLFWKGYYFANCWYTFITIELI